MKEELLNKKEKLLLERQDLEKQKKGCHVSMLISAVLTMMVLFALVSIPIFIYACVKLHRIDKRLTEINKELGLKVI